MARHLRVSLSMILALLFLFAPNGALRFAGDPAMRCAYIFGGHLRGFRTNFGLDAVVRHIVRPSCGSSPGLFSGPPERNVFMNAGSEEKVDFALVAAAAGIQRPLRGDGSHTNSSLSQKQWCEEVF